MVIAASTGLCLLAFCSGTMNAAEPEPAGNVIVFENFDGLTEGPVAEQGNWTVSSAKSFGSDVASPEVIAIENTGSILQNELTNLALSGPLDSAKGEGVCIAFRPLDHPLEGSETLVIEYDLLRRSGDYLQVGLANKNGRILPGINISSGNFMVRGDQFEEVAKETPAPEKTAPPLKYGNWYRIRTTWNGEQGTVRVEYKDLTAGKDTFHTVYFDKDRKIAEYNLNSAGVFKGAAAVLVRMPSSKSIDESRNSRPDAESSVIDNISVSIN